MRGERCEPEGGRAWGVVAAHRRHARGRGPTQGLGSKGTRGERTWNMECMSVTLEVSKLSGWLKVDAYCRVEGRACDAGGRGASRKAGEPGVVAARQAACTGGTGPTQGLGAKGTRGAHEEHVAHMVVTLEVSKLSGWLKADASCRVEGRACDAGGRGASREAGGPGVWWRHTRGMHGEKARLKAWGPRARAERTGNMPHMVVTLEVSKFSGWLKADAYCAESKGGHAMRGGRGASREAGGPGVLWWRHTRGMHGGNRPDSRPRGQGHARSAQRTCGSWS